MRKVNKIFQSATQFGKHLRDLADIPLQVKQAKLRKTIRQVDKDVATLRGARAYDNAPNRNADGSPSDAMKARTMADEVRMRRKKKKY